MEAHETSATDNHRNLDRIVDHLHEALNEEDPAMKNYHVRRALQRCVFATSGGWQAHVE